MKKVLCTLLSVALCLITVSFPVSAEESARYTISPEVAGTETAVVLTDDDLTINEEVAEYIAQFFVEDIMATGQTTWETEPTIVNTVPMYDGNGEEITAYTVELSSGYVVISAYIDVPNIILEWADEAEPAYTSCNLETGSEIVYVGALDYLIDNGGPRLTTVDGLTVKRSDVTNTLKGTRNVANLKQETIRCLVRNRFEALQNPSISPLAANNTRGGYITDPFAYAENLYGGSWVSSEWGNNWEDYANFAFQSQFPSYLEACGPIAITNMVKMYENKYNDTGITSKTNASVFMDVIDASSLRNPPYYINASAYSGGGVDDESASPYISDVFNHKFDVDVTVLGRYSASYGNVKGTLSSQNRLMYLMLKSNDGNNSWHPYGNHAVVGYAFTQLENVGGSTTEFVKICDGKASAARYVQLFTLSNAKYWDVNF